MNKKSSKNRFICFEGVDGAGKTTLAKLVAEELGYQYYASPPQIILPIREVIYKYSNRVRVQYYELGNLITSEEVNHILDTESVVVDRYIYSTLAYHFGDVTKGLTINDFQRPDQIIYVTASWDAIESRLLNRSDRKNSENIQYLKLVAEEFKQILAQEKKVYRIDTTNKGVEDSLEEIKKILGEK